MERTKNQIYYSYDSDRFYTEADIREEMEEEIAAGETFATDDFESFLRNCLAENNGGLHRVEDIIGGLAGHVVDGDGLHFCYYDELSSFMENLYAFAEDNNIEL